MDELGESRVDSEEREPSMSDPLLTTTVYREALVLAAGKAVQEGMTNVATKAASALFNKRDEVDSRPIELIEQIERERSYDAHLQTPTEPMDHFPTVEAHIADVKTFLNSGFYYGFPLPSSVPKPSRWTNYKAYLLNNHPILSMCFQHPLNPFSPASRAIFLVCSLSYSLFLTAAFGITADRANKWCLCNCTLTQNYNFTECPLANVEHFGGCCVNCTASEIYPSIMHTFVAPTISHFNGQDNYDPFVEPYQWISKEQYDISCAYDKYYGLVAPATIAVLSQIYEIILRSAATGFNAHKSLYAREIGCCSSVVVVIITAISFFFLIAGMVGILSYHTGVSSAVTLVTSSLYSWIILYPLIRLIMFHCLYTRAKMKFKAKYPGLSSIWIDERNGGESRPGCQTSRLPDISEMQNAISST